MKKKIACAGRILWDSVETANSFFKRFKGLMGRRSLLESEGMLITCCNQVHTFNMRFTIDVIYLSKQMRVVRVDTLPPNRIGPFVKNAVSVLEVAAGTSALNGIKLGDELALI
ncbi:MAG: hypothetical protein BWY11_00316 [Firmicutes bacterium ADurb.Bin182]|nr:MAG: hypothetical protein BWY11_00316 [Firmicutes bacterium ADurb.Bin182]